MQPFKRDVIRHEIEQLKGPVLTFYLNTNPANEEWKIRLKNSLKRTEEYEKVSNPEDAKKITQIVRNINIKVRDMNRNLATSLVCFASQDDILLYPFRFPVDNDFIWKEEPATEQLEQLFEKYVRTGIILLQANSVTLITATLGELEDEVHYEIDFDTESWKRYKGLAFGGIISSSANHRHKFERRMRENQARWYKDILTTIQNYARDKGWKSVYLVGPAALTSGLRKQLDVNITAEINRNYAGKSALRVLERTIYAPKDE